MVELIGGGSVINGATLSSLYITKFLSLKLGQLKNSLLQNFKTLSTSAVVVTVVIVVTEVTVG